MAASAYMQPHTYMAYTVCKQYTIQYTHNTDTTPTSTKKTMTLYMRHKYKLYKILDT